MGDAGRRHLHRGALATLIALAAAPLGAQQAAGPASAAGAVRVVVAGVDLTGVGYDQGSPTAPVVIVNFSDFGCPYCATFSRESHPALHREFIATGKVRYKYVPFAMGIFPNGKQAARASECAAEQGRFWPMHERLYVRQRDWKNTVAAFPVFAAEAARVGIDAVAFARCYATRVTDRRTEGASILARRLGIRATPTFYVDGRAIEGALPLAQFQTLVRTLIAEKSR